MSFLSLAHHYVDREIFQKQIHVRKGKAPDHQPLGLPGLGASILCFMYLSQPVGCGISRNVDKTSQKWGFSTAS